MTHLLIEIHCANQVATIGTYAIEGKDVIGPFDIAQCSIRAKDRTQPLATLVSEAMDNMAPTIAHLWPGYLAFDKVYLSCNFEPLQKALHESGKERRWFTLTDTRPFDSSLTEKWIEIKTYGKTNKGTISKRPTQIDYIRPEQYQPEPKPTAEPQTLFNLPNDGTGCDWDIKRYTADGFIPDDNQEVKRYSAYRSFALAEKVSKAGKPYDVLVKAPCPTSSPWQAVDRLAYSHNGYQCVLRDSNRMRVAQYIMELKLDCITIDAVEELEF